MWSDLNPAITSSEDMQCIMFDALVKSFHPHKSCQIETGPPVFSLEQIREFLRHCLARMSQEFSFGVFNLLKKLSLLLTYFVLPVKNMAQLAEIGSCQHLTIRFS